LKTYFFKVKNKDARMEGVRVKMSLFLLNFKWFLERFFKRKSSFNLPLKCLAPQNKVKSLYLGSFWFNFSTLLRNALDFTWYPLWLWFKIAKFGFWNSPKKCLDFLLLGRSEGVKKAKKNFLIFFPN